MSEAETIELVAVYGSNAMPAFTIYISFTFGYLVTAYMVVANLTPFQSIVASGLYVLAAGAAATAHILWLDILFAVVQTAPTVLDARPLLQGSAWLWGMSIIQIAGILLSLNFLLQIRRRTTD